MKRLNCQSDWVTFGLDNRKPNMKGVEHNQHSKTNRIILITPDGEVVKHATEVRTDK